MNRIFALLSSLAVLSVGLTSSAQKIADQKTVTFTADIKPLIDTKCVTCHVKGGSAPFPLQTYAQVKKRAELCWRMMLTRTMPPCTARSGTGEFCEGGGPLTDEQSVVLQRWLDAGAPEGAPSNPVPTPDHTTWRLGKPSLVLKPTQTIEIPEEGRPYWRAYVLPLDSLVGKRLRAFDVRVAQPLAVRSAVLAVARPGLLGTIREKEGWDTGGSLNFNARKLLGAWAPGYPAWSLPKGVSMSIDTPALVLQLLYLPRGKAESGDFEVALYFSKDAKDKEAQWLEMGQEEFSVPAPGSLVLEPKGHLPAQSSLLAALPEARFFCTSVRMYAGDQLLFSTRRWEPYWQGPYVYNPPVEFPKGTDLRSEFNYDNDIHMGRNDGRRPRPILGGYREREELCRMHVLYVDWSGP